MAGRREEALQENPSKLGVAVRTWRRHRGLTVSALAVHSGFGKNGRGYISKIEHGIIRDINPRHLTQIASALGVSADELLHARLPLTVQGMPQIVDGHRPLKSHMETSEGDDYNATPFNVDSVIGSNTGTVVDSERSESTEATEQVGSAPITLAELQQMLAKVGSQLRQATGEVARLEGEITYLRHLLEVAKNDPAVSSDQALHEETPREQILPWFKPQSLAHQNAAQTLPDTQTLSKEMFEEIVLRWQQPLLRSAMLLVPVQDEAVDIVEDVFVEAYQNACKGIEPFVVGGEPDRIRHWLFQRVTWRGLDSTRRTRINRQASTLGESDTTIPVNQRTSRSFEDLLADHEIVNQAMRALKPRERVCLILDMQGVPRAEIADRFDITEANVRQIISRSRRFIRTFIKEATVIPIEAPSGGELGESIK